MTTSLWAVIRIMFPNIYLSCKDGIGYCFNNLIKIVYVTKYLVNKAIYF